MAHVCIRLVLPSSVATVSHLRLFNATVNQMLFDYYTRVSFSFLLKGRDGNFNWYTNAFMSAPAIYKYAENKLVGRQVRINNSLPA